MDNINLSAILANPDEYDLESQTKALGRERKLADLLMAQGQQQPQGQMVSGRFVKPAWTQQIAPLANSFASGFVSDRADKKESELTKASKLRSAMQLQKFAELEQTDPAEAYKYGLSIDNKTINAYTLKRLEGDKLRKDEIISRPNLGGGKTVLEGLPSVPTSAQEAILYEGLPKDPRTWTPEQRAIAKNSAVGMKKAGAGGNVDLGALIEKKAPDDIVKMMGEGKGNAQNALQTVDAANNILTALDSNKIFAGAGANIKIPAARIADAIGAGGKDTKDKLSNSTMAIRSLAKLTLQGRKQMRGEGAITGPESALAEQAESGRIDFSPAELRMLANAAKRSAKFQFDNHQSMYKQFENDAPQSAKYYRVDADPSIFENRPNKPATPKSNNVDAALQIIKGGQ